MQPPNVAPKTRVRGMILTVAITAVTVVGTIVGAGLKTDIESSEKKKIIAEPAREDELIAALETRRMNIVRTKATWEKKAEALRERMERNAQNGVVGGEGSGNAASGK